MKNRDSKQKLSRNSGHTHKRIVIENICEPRAEPSDGAALQMTLLFFTTRTPWVRASKVATAHFHSLAHGGCWSRPFNDKEVILNRNSEAWFVKVVCTLFVRWHLSDTCLGYLRKNLTPLIAFEVVRRLNNPKLGLKFFEFSRESLSVSHSFNTYNLLMRSLCQMGLYDSAKMVFDCMRSDGHLPDSSIVGFLVSSYAQVGKFDLAKKLLAEVQFDEIGLSSFVYNKLLDELVKRNLVDEAVCLFREHMGSYFHLDTCTFNILIRGLCRIGGVDKAFVFFNDMGRFGCSPDVLTYNTLINGLCRVNEVNRGHELLKEVKSTSELKPDVVTYTSVISGYCKLGKMDEASILFYEMVKSGIKPTAITFNVLVDGFRIGHV
jgi:pentatricopeptide repeat protein